jgi:hypothetical protein
MKQPTHFQIYDQLKTEIEKRLAESARLKESAAALGPQLLAHASLCGKTREAKQTIEQCASSERSMPHCNRCGSTRIS